MQFVEVLILDEYAGIGAEHYSSNASFIERECKSTSASTSTSISASISASTSVSPFAPTVPTSRYCTSQAMFSLT